MGGGKGGDSKAIYNPRYTGVIEDMLTAQALGSVIKSNPNMGMLLNNYAGQGMFGGIGGGGAGQSMNRGFKPMGNSMGLGKPPQDWSQKVFGR